MGKGAERNKLCECGSGKKIKKCNCKISMMNKIFPQGTLFATSEGTFKALGVILEKDYPNIPDSDSEKWWYAPFCNIQQIERIFNPQNCQDILLKKQADSVIDNMRVNRVFYQRYNTSEKWDIEEQFDKSIFTMFSMILKGTDFYEEFEKVPCGTTYDSDANGQCIKTQFGNIITISETLKDFLYYMNLFYYGIHEKDIPLNVMYAARSIALRIMLRTEALDFDLDPRGEIPTEIESVISSNTKWELLFVVAHEFAHNILGHLDDGNIIRCVENDETYIIYNQSQQQEFDADVKAIDMMKNTLGIKTAVEMAVGFFMSLDLFEQAKEQIFPSMTSYKTHPDAVERIRNIYKYFRLNKDEFEKYILFNDKIKEELLDDISVNMDQYEIYGSVYLGEWHKKMLKDRIDY